MKHSEFYIGLEFMASAGFIWKCTDVGSRTIIAIQLTPAYDETWQVGPPYALQEVVFDEHDIKSCYLDEKAMILERISESVDRLHPGFSQKEVSRMMKSRISDNSSKYPRQNILRFDRVYGDTIIHGFSAFKQPYTETDVYDIDSPASWTVRVLDLVSKNFFDLHEKEFNELTDASSSDFKRIFKM